MVREKRAARLPFSLVGTIILTMVSVIGAISYFGVLRDKWLLERVLWAEAEEKNTHLTHVKRAAKKHVSYKKQIEGFKRSPVKIRRQFPSSQKSSFLFDTISAQADAAGLLLLDFSSQKPIVIETLLHLPAKVVLKGSFFDLLNFLEGIKVASNVLRVVGMSLKNEGRAIDRQGLTIELELASILLSKQRVKGVVKAF